MNIHGCQLYPKIAIYVVKQHKNDSFRQGLYKGFKQECPNGNLTPVNFVDMYKMFFPSGNAEQFCDHTFRTFDADKNGTIDFKEFLLAIDVTSAGTAEEKLKWAFRQAIIYYRRLWILINFPILTYSDFQKCALIFIQ